MKKATRDSFGKACLPVIAIAMTGNLAVAQDFRNEIVGSLFATSLRSSYPQRDNYVGVALEYSYRPVNDLAIAVQYADSSNRNYQVDGILGYGVAEVSGVARFGPRLHRIRPSAELGTGILFARVFGGLSVDGSGLYPVRRYPEFIVGGAVEVEVSHHFTLMYELRDNHTYISSFDIVNTGIPDHTDARRVDNPEGRVGIAFRF